MISLLLSLLLSLRTWARSRAPLQLEVLVFSSVAGTELDESNVRKAFNRLLDAAELHRRGPHQMRHTFASLLLQDGAPITYVSQQLGHKDPSITLRVYAHWLPDASTHKLVNTLDDAAPDVTRASPETSDEEVQRALSPYERMVSQTFASWNQIGEWLRRLEELQRLTSRRGAEELPVKIHFAAPGGEHDASAISRTERENLIA